MAGEHDGEEGRGAGGPADEDDYTRDDVREALRDEGQPKVIVQAIEREMSRSYIDYSMSVIIGRALPDVRDGLKPVHRKIMYAMYDMGLAHNRPHKKSARIVGDVLGKYHPHGDSAAYDAMVRMAQPFSLRYPLVDGQGNFGSVDGDSAAAMRYTEARLSRISGDLLADLDKDTVDMVDNYDGTLKEPSVLPSKFPNLLVNGSSGIAVGMATNMPPHNLSEVVDGIVHFIDHPDADTSEIMRFIKGPDFPTGGTIYGLDGIVSAYNTGRGRVRVRANTHVEEKRNGRVAIIVDEIPFQVNKARLLEQIAERVKSKEIEGITDLRDESDRSGMRIVIEIHKDAMEAVVLENLYRKTAMEQTFGIINLALVDNKPRMLTLRDLMGNYVEHRRDVVVRRTRFDLGVAEKRYHILEGLMAAFDMLDETIALIRASKDGEAASAGLQELLSIDAEQAKAILEMRLQKLTGLEITALRDEHEQLFELMEDLKDILAHEGRVNQIIKDELVGMKEAYGDERRTAIDPVAIDSDDEDLIPREDVVITVSKDSYIKRIPLRTYRQQRRGGVGLIGMTTKEEDDVASMFVCSSHEYVMFITDAGRLLWLKAYRIPEGSRQAKGKPLVNLLPDLQEGERVVNTICTGDFPQDRYLLFCTRNGTLKKTALNLYGNIRTRGIKAIRFDEGDELIETELSDGAAQIIIATRGGLAVRFPEEEVRPTGRDTRGVRGIRLDDGDAIVSMAAVKEGDLLLTVTENGFGKISQVEDYRLTHRGGRGVITIKATERNGPVVAVRRVSLADQLMVTSMQGKIIRIRVADIRVTGRIAAGVKIMDLRNDDKVIAIRTVDAECDSAEDVSEDAAEPAGQAPPADGGAGARDADGSAE